MLQKRGMLGGIFSKVFAPLRAIQTGANFRAALSTGIVFGYQRASASQHQSASNNNRAPVAYTSKRINNNDNNNDHPAVNFSSPRLASHRSDTNSPIYKSKRSIVSDDNRECRLLLERLKQGDRFGEAERDMLLKFATTQEGSGELSNLCTNDEDDVAVDVMAAVINLVQGSVADLACDPDFGPCFVRTGCEMGHTGSKRNGDTRVRDVMMDELLMSNEIILNSAFTCHGQVLIGSILKLGTKSERDVVLDAMKGNMVELAIDNNGRDLVSCALDCLPAELWKPLGDELLASCESILCLAHNHGGVFLLRDLLGYNADPAIMYEYNAKIADVFIDNVHALLKQKDRKAMFALNIVLTHVAQELRDELCVKVLNIPGEDFVRYVMQGGISKNIKLIIDLCASDQLKVVAKAFAGSVSELMRNETGKQAMITLVDRLKADEVNADEVERVELIAALKNAGFSVNNLRMTPKQETRKILCYLRHRK